VKQVIKTEKKPIKLWLDTIEEGALRQSKNLANLPFTFRHVALMPDCHEGFGMPIGGVLATENAIIPNAVGVDIGCGMCAVKTNITHIESKDVKKLMSRIRQRIPLGFKHHKKEQAQILMPNTQGIPSNGIVEQEYRNALTQIGTLGGGNHFIEIQKGNDHHIWLMVHSGSRNIGNQVAQYYNRLAKKKHEQWALKVDPKADLAYFPTESAEAQNYIAEMRYCIDFAFANRKLMVDRILEIFEDEFSSFSSTNFINIAHNYSIQEEHFGKKVWVHRKGATSAKKGEIGIILGSQGTKSYIVQGKGNKQSFESCSHGAGRIMGRKQAQRTLNLEEEKERLDQQGVIHSIRSIRDLDEAPSAYKDISEVMKNQEDLVDVLVELSPLAVIKG
jgi:tRNA-splicing ligase RtcB